MKHGNEDTVREMLRIKRSVQATFNTQVNFMSTQMLVAQTSIEAAEAAQGGNRRKELNYSAGLTGVNMGRYDFVFKQATKWRNLKRKRDNLQRRVHKIKPRATKASCLSGKMTFYLLPNHFDHVVVIFVS